MSSTKSLLLAASGLCFLLAGALLGQDPRKEEGDAAKYYRKWLDEDVVYLITEGEREVFSKLSTDDERDHFIEQFWTSRDSDLTTALNETKEEHYRRLAYVNGKYGSGIPGWKTDRGRVYIMYGPPDETEYNAGGGETIRKPWEGGGRTSTYPFEIWTYNHIPGLGGDVELEFVDRSWTGEFKLALYPWEKDMLLHIEGVGQTTAEKLGLASRAYRPGLHPGFMNDTNFQKKMMGMRQKDTPFERQLLYFKLQKPPEIRQKELQTIVDARVSYQVLPVSMDVHHIWVNDQQALVPITLEVANRELQFNKEGQVNRARVGIYGKVTSMSGKVVSEFEEILVAEYSDAHIDIGRQQRSVFQKTVATEPGRYKVELVVKDMNSANLGTIAESLLIPSLPLDQLTASPVVLADQLEMLDAFPDAPTTFVIGDVRVVPNVKRQFKSGEELGVYCQVHNPGIDSSSLEPSVEIEYEISRNGKLQTRYTDRSGASIEFASAQRLVLVRKIMLEEFAEGRYELKVKVSDQLSGQTAETRSTFEIVG